MAKHKRRIYIVDKRGQWSYVWRIVGLEVIVAICSALMAVFATIYVINLEELGEVSELGSWLQIYGYLILFIIIAGIGLIYGGIRLSHRIFGPIYRFKQTLSEPAESSNQRVDIKLRAKDEFKDLAEIINQHLKLQREQAEKFSELKERFDEIQKKMNSDQ